MSADNTTDALPILDDRGFDIAMRGYDRRQVEEYVSQLDEEVRAEHAARSAAEARSADLAAHIGSAQAQIESLRRQLQIATQEVNEDNVAPRVRELLESAKATAQSLRADADAYAVTTRTSADEAAARVRAAAQAEADQILDEATQRHAEADETFRRRLSEAERHHADVTAEANAQLDLARTQEAQITREAEASRQRLDAEAAAERATAAEDFEIALRARRTEEQRLSAEQIAAAQVRAEQIVTDAEAEAVGLRQQAEAHLAGAKHEAEQIVRDAHEQAGRLTDAAAAEVRDLAGTARRCARRVAQTASAAREGDRRYRCPGTGRSVTRSRTAALDARGTAVAIRPARGVPVPSVTGVGVVSGPGHHVRLPGAHLLVTAGAAVHPARRSPRDRPDDVRLATPVVASLAHGRARRARLVDHLDAAAVLPGHQLRVGQPKSRKPLPVLRPSRPAVTSCSSSGAGAYPGSRNSWNSVRSTASVTSLPMTSISSNGPIG